ncbi:hypothetical protein [uncultured Psychrobacter sp.]|nr:hypothetical protein [uncultured Psychrobacter sp.]
MLVSPTAGARHLLSKVRAGFNGISIENKVSADLPASVVENSSEQT